MQLTIGPSGPWSRSLPLFIFWKGVILVQTGKDYARLYNKLTTFLRSLESPSITVRSHG